MKELEMAQRNTITYDVLVQYQPEGGYIASVLGWPDCVVEGETQDEALTHARTAILEQLTRGQVVRLEFKKPHLEVSGPSLDHFGHFRDDPTFDDFLSEVEAYRREMDVEYERL